GDGTNRHVRIEGTGWLPFGSIVQSVVPSHPLPVQPPPASAHPGPVGALSGMTASLPLLGQPTPTTSTSAVRPRSRTDGTGEAGLAGAGTALRRGGACAGIVLGRPV